MRYSSPRTFRVHGMTSHTNKINWNRVAHGKFNSYSLAALSAQRQQQQQQKDMSAIMVNNIALTLIHSLGKSFLCQIYSHMLQIFFQKKE